MDTPMRMYLLTSFCLPIALDTHTHDNKYISSMEI